MNNDEALQTGAAWIELPGRAQIEMTGDDRASFLHNLCTNEVKALTPGSGCETFFTNVQGKTIGFGYLFVSETSIVIDSEPGEAETLLSHLDKYLISEKVELVDHSDEGTQFLVAGPRAAELLSGFCGDSIPQELFAHREFKINGASVHVRCVDYAGPGSYLLRVSPDAGDAIQQALTQAEILQASEADVEARRIEQGTPRFGVDLDATNLPQELARDDRAISFTKGCYLGQETVARIDALGHVNRVLVGLAFEGEEIPPAGTPLTHESNEVGRVTSACFSPRRGQPLALAFLKRKQSAAGSQVESALGTAEVVKLPI